MALANKSSLNCGPADCPVQAIRRFHRRLKLAFGTQIMGSPIISFIVVALLCALGLWFIAQFPTLDATIVKFIRIAVLVVLSLLLINLVLVLLTGAPISRYLHG